MDKFERHRHNPGRLFIDVQDIMNVLVCGKTAAYERIRNMRMVYRKQKHQRITVREFAEYEGIAEEEVRKRMG